MERQRRPTRCRTTASHPETSRRCRGPNTGVPRRSREGRAGRGWRFGSLDGRTQSQHATHSFRSRTASLSSKNYSLHAGLRAPGIYEPLRSVRTGAWDVRAPGMWQLDDCRTRREEILQSGMPKGPMGVRKQQALLQRTPIHGSQLQVENKEKSNDARESKETSDNQKAG